MFDSPFLRKNLFWPLTAASVLSLGVAYFAPWGGLFVNLATTFVGILLTVGYVDLVLREHQNARWSRAIARIAERLDSVATVASSQFRIAFGFPVDVYDHNAMSSPHPAIARAELARVAQHVLRPMAREAIAALNTTQWTTLVGQLKITWESADRLIELYASQLHPDTIATLIELQDHMHAMMQRHRTFPDVLGVPDSELKPNLKGESTLPLKRALEEASARDIRAVLDASIALLAQADKMASGRPAP